MRRTSLIAIIIAAIIAALLVMKPGTHVAPPEPPPNPAIALCNQASGSETPATADASIAICGQVLADKSSTPAARASMGRAYLAKARADAATRDFPNALKDATAALPSGDPLAHFYRGEAAARTGDYAGAVADEAAFLMGNPNGWQAFYWKAVAEDHLAGGLAAAAHDLSASARINPSYAPAVAELGLVDFKQKDLPSAYYDETRALALFMAQPAPGDADYPVANCMAFAIRAAAEVQLLRYVDAKADASAAIALGVPGEWRAMAFKNLGYVELKSGDYTGAAEALSQAQALSPDDKEVRLWLEAARQGRGGRSEV